MKIVNISGGLGNQMFQYAFALTLKEKFPKDEILIDISHYNYLFIKKWKTSNLHNGFEIDKIFPNASLPIATGKDLLKVTWYVPNYWLSRIVRKIFPKRKTEYVQIPPNDTSYDSLAYSFEGDFYYEGYWQSISFYLPYRDKICKVYSHPSPNEKNADYINKIKTTDSVGIHIRRGDYLEFDDYKGICDLEYYRKSIDEILSDGKVHSFFIFSNDIEWCKKNISPLLRNSDCYYINHNKGSNSCWDMFLMSYCTNLVIANSTFSWWGAFLNHNQGKIIAPKKWNNRKCNFDYWMPNWLKF